MFFDGDEYDGMPFEKTYRCYPASVIGKFHVENGDKVILPPSALDHLASLHMDYPMMFEIRNAATQRVSHCGVLEFTAEEGLIYMPIWMMENLSLQGGGLVQIKNVTLPKGTYFKLQPHTKDFLDISNPKAILEKMLRNFSCLSTGDSIMIAYSNRKYYLDIIEAKPSNAISITDTDCEVDFAPPLDYKEPEKPPLPTPACKAKTDGQNPETEAQPSFNPFTGSGRRLDGKPLKSQPLLPSPSNAKRTDLPGGDRQASASSSGSQSTRRQWQGKLVFGSNSTRSPAVSKETGNDTKKQESPKKDESGFQAFSGKKYSLLGL